MLQSFRRNTELYGVKGALKLAYAKIFRGSRSKILALETAEERFTKIYTSGHWTNPESLSGEGSTLHNTTQLRAALPGLFRTHEVTRVLDAPCGDFNWMQHVVADTGVDYTGGDIVAPLVAENNRRFGREGLRFVHLDITRDALPAADLMICRDCLFHLSYADIFRFFERFAASEIPLLLTTTQGMPGAPVPNRDIVSGDMRNIDLFSAPFGLTPDVLAAIEDPQSTRDLMRHMVLVTRDDVAALAARGPLPFPDAAADAKAEA